ncbi:hypothetical protein QBC46DRAFT_352034 [Diplogelasinospora grovesii]|uniref:Peptidase S8/S53 domain-containing protein n=1 Tax=Diplogelasinospora grovesii TaxID=303347 RepID=A0AAN6S6X0_9PEZI|nr:hypothetical protein QBC46DRAFT_352034 [Diplogelasinospora grovesii]
MWWTSGGCSGGTDLYMIFHWLKNARDGNKKRVKKVIEVMVEDFGNKDSRPHSDEAIFHCLGRLGVEIWNWMRLDISSQLIEQTSEHVREVHLYRSGLGSVLRGWSDSDVQNYGLSILRSIRYYHQQTFLSRDRGLESIPRMHAYFEASKTRLQHQAEQVHHPPIEAILKDDRIVPTPVELATEQSEAFKGREKGQDGRNGSRAWMPLQISLAYSMIRQVHVPARCDPSSQRAPRCEKRSHPPILCEPDTTTESNQTLPYYEGPNFIFCIGAATKEGHCWSRKIAGADTSCDQSFFLPGEHLGVPPHRGEPPKNKKHHPDDVPARWDTYSGSSLSCALATGLAAMILHCTQLGKARASSHDWHWLRTHEGMKRAMENIGITATRWLPVRKFFGNENLAKPFGVDAKKEQLKRLVVDKLLVH